MKKIVLTSIAVIGTSIMTFAQKDTTVKTPVIKDTIKTKQTGMIYSTESMLAFDPQTDSTKNKKPTLKPDTLKTGSVDFKSGMYYALLSPQTDSSKTKKAAKTDSVKVDTKKNTGSIDVISFSSIALLEGPQTDSTKTKSAPAKLDSTTTKPSDKKTGLIQNEGTLYKKGILEA